MDSAAFLDWLRKKFDEFRIGLWTRLNDLYASRIIKRLGISDDDFVYRRVPAIHRKPDGTIASCVFDHFEMSVDLASLTSPEKTLRRAKDKSFGVARLSVRKVRALPVPQEVKHWPEMLNYAHSLVVGEKKKSGKMSKRIASLAEWAVQPPSDQSLNS